MRFTVALALVSASIVAGQTTTSTTAAASVPTSGICAMNIVDNCVEQYKIRVNACNANANDWVCLCDEYTNYLTCYNNCPSSPDKPPVQNQVTQYCAAAAPLKASLSSVAVTAVKATSTLSSAASGTGTASGSAGASSIASASGFSTSTNAAQPLTVPMGGAFAFVMGVAGLL